MSTLSPEEVRASIHAPSTFIPSTNTPPKANEAADVAPMVVEETPPSDSQIVVKGMLTGRVE